jgi:type IV pilus assembly protein PilC
MKTFRYTAYDMSGKRHVGRGTANEESLFRDSMKEQGLFLVELDEVVHPAKRSERLTTKELPEFARGIGTLITAGVPLAQTMEALQGENKNAKLRAIYDKTGQYVKEGILFSDALRLQKDVFPPLFMNMISSAEETGRLGESLMQSAEYYEKQYRLQSKVRGAMAYPVFLLFLSLAIMMGVFTFIIPYFTDIVGASAVTGLTAVFMKISTVLRENFLYITLGIIAFAAIFTVLIQRPDVRRAIDKGLLSIPRVGALFETIYTARFAQTMAYLYLSGVSVVNGLKNTKYAIGNAYVVDQFDTLIREVTGGKMLSEAIVRVDGIQNSIKWPIRIGEESGELGQMLLSTSDALTYESERAAEKLTSFLGPVMIIILATMVGMIMISVLMPILNMYQGIGSGYGM